MIIAFTGAGVSKESGIDTFQDRPGIREKLYRSYALAHPQEYREVMREFVNGMKDKEPNDAHIALAEYNIPIITMNVDGLHKKAGSENVIELHGGLPSEEQLEYCEKLINLPVLYGDPAPNYQKAYSFVDAMRPRDILLVIGASDYTMVANILREMAKGRGAEIVEIQDNAATKVRKFLEEQERT